MAVAKNNPIIQNTIMNNTTKTVSVLTDLLHITNDRIQGFSKVEDKVWDTYPTLRADYDGMVTQSQKMKRELSQLIAERNGSPDQSGSAAGALHRTWIDLINSFGSNEASTTLGNVLYGEQAAINAYEKALDSGDLCPESSRVVLDHLHHLKASFQKFENIEEAAKKL